MIAIACDHAALHLKKAVTDYLESKKIAYRDFGAADASSCDYPDFAFSVSEAVAAGAYKYGVLLCGTGIGMSIAANKVKGVRAAVAYDEFSAKRARSHNDANVLCLGETVLGEGLALSILDIFLNTPFEGGRHANRINKISDYENKGAGK